MSFIDPYGLSIQTKNCGGPKSNKTRIIKKAIQRAVQYAKSCIECRDPKELLDKLNNFQVKCVTWTTNPYTGTPNS